MLNKIKVQFSVKKKRCTNAVFNTCRETTHPHIITQERNQSIHIHVCTSTKYVDRYVNTFTEASKVMKWYILLESAHCLLFSLIIQKQEHGDTAEHNSTFNDKWITFLYFYCTCIRINSQYMYNDLKAKHSSDIAVNDDMSLFLEEHAFRHVFISKYHSVFDFLLLSFWRTTATVVKKFPRNKTRKQSPHIKTWHHVKQRERYMSKHKSFTAWSFSWYMEGIRWG